MCSGGVQHSRKPAGTVIGALAQQRQAYYQAIIAPRGAFHRETGHRVLAARSRWHAASSRGQWLLSDSGVEPTRAAGAVNHALHLALISLGDTAPAPVRSAPWLCRRQALEWSVSSGCFSPSARSSESRLLDRRPRGTLPSTTEATIAGAPEIVDVPRFIPTSSVSRYWATVHVVYSVTVTAFALGVMPGAMDLRAGGTRCARGRCLRGERDFFQSTVRLLAHVTRNGYSPQLDRTTRAPVVLPARALLYLSRGQPRSCPWRRFKPWVVRATDRASLHGRRARWSDRDSVQAG